VVEEINPQLASHGGKVAVQEVSAEGVVLLRFGGGCQGCGMADVTLKQGVKDPDGPRAGRDRRARRDRPRQWPRAVYPSRQRRLIADACL
jgi:hypothetical protein